MRPTNSQVHNKTLHSKSQCESIAHIHVSCLAKFHITHSSGCITFKVLEV